MRKADDSRPYTTISGTTRAPPTVSYAERWSHLRGGPVNALDRDKAQSRHEKGSLYVAIISDANRPLAYLEVRLDTGFVGVHFLDERRRDRLVYLFTGDSHAESGEGLFLEQVIRREYRDDAEELARAERYVFEKTGAVRVEDAAFDTETIESRDLVQDVSGNWEAVPEFGRYESIGRVER